MISTARESTAPADCPSVPLQEWYHCIVDRTLLGKPRLSVRGGRLTVASGPSEDDAAPLQIGAEPQILGRRHGCHLVLADKKVSATHCEFVATERGVRLRDLGSSNGTFVGSLRVVEALLDEQTTIRCGDTTLEFEPGRPERLVVSKHEKFGPLVGGTTAMRALFERLRVVSPTTVSVLVQGETGTGKELVAQAIHEASDRAARPFVVIDCGAIAANLAESTLFGHERGAFTGAVSRSVSPFVQASGGTVFLDELGELPLDVQPKLLRVLAEQRVKSVGSAQYVPVNVRVVAATRRNLLEDINRGGFRDDLYFRIAQAPVVVPPLRERREDIVPLVKHMMDLAGKAASFKRITSEAIERIERHDWPGNVRELKNLVSVGLAYDRGTGPIDLAAHLHEPMPKARKPRGGALVDRPYVDSKYEHDRVYFSALHEATDNISEIARRSALNRETVRTYLRTHKLGDYGRERK